MMHFFITLSFVSSSCSTISVLALLIPFDVHVQTPANNPATHFPRQSSSNGILPVGNTQNSFYYTNIMLDGQNISVMLDTGSSDLWVTGSIPGATDTGSSLKLSYAVGMAAGDIYTAPFEFAGQSVSDQAFLLVANVSSFSTNIHSEGYDSLIGLGPNSGSSIYKKLDGNSGNNPINSILEQTSSNDYITMMLSRKGDPGSNITDQFTIGELIPGFENITSMPHLSIEKVYRVTDADQHWQIVTDKNNGIIGPDGQPIKYSSIAPKAPDGTIVGVLDSGFTLPQVPRTVSDAIYGHVQGAKWLVANEAWLVAGNLLMLPSILEAFHILFTHSMYLWGGLLNWKPCLPGNVTSAFSLLGEYDMILGMAFLRNTYTLINYGNFITGGSNSNSPYVQLLPLTNVESAVNNLIQVRLNGQNTINCQKTRVALARAVYAHTRYVLLGGPFEHCRQSCYPVLARETHPRTVDGNPYEIPAVQILNDRGEFSASMGVLPPTWRPCVRLLPWYRKGGIAVKNLAGLAVAAVAKRFTTPTDHVDLLSKLQEGRDDEGNLMGRKELTAEALTQLIAGSDTTSNSSCAITYYLAANPPVQLKLQKELDDALGSEDEYVSTLAYSFDIDSHATRFLHERLIRGPLMATFTRHVELMLPGTYYLDDHIDTKGAVNDLHAQDILDFPELLRTMLGPLLQTRLTY
ncbi:aspartic peptidase domain-containing protein [Suillus fuscotomentosus]|uniref:Aspartic peptidase domain-containing protein n=1 Tax=Suillus fuscotomentosus TaxID=1912939 RepID=A0AAD4E404_9AGAM|nr:aspartic peptidase domain-containing protein [Suillus fuscotomentosus]KAG1897873.1 aspartic peptidase domain-containing protein [Suillus fuscotomentosus]